MSEPLKIDIARLMGRIEAMASVGQIEGGGVNRLALSEADRDGRDLLVEWMQDLNLQVTIDAIGNIVGQRSGSKNLAPVMTGSHLDSVATGGRYDGTLGVLAGLEVVERLDELNVETRHPIAVGCFSNEEGARFAPDMLGSAVYQGSLDLQSALNTSDADGCVFGDCLDAIGYRGNATVPAAPPHAFVELHIEQGPVLENAGITIGAVESVQGISWTEYTIDGVSNHAGTTPMSMRKDAGYAASALACAVREIATELGAPQVATVGALSLEPNLVNVVARRATMTVDLRNVDDAILIDAESRVAAVVDRISEREGVHIQSRILARFQPVRFSESIVRSVTHWAERLKLSTISMPSGAGHDAQMFAPRCPTGMIFVPSRDGISHNVREHTDRSDIEAGANILINLLTELATEDY